LRKPEFMIEGAVVRPWRLADLGSLVQHANDVEVARYLAPRFPSPYTVEDGKAWLELTETFDDPLESLAIVVEGEACGAIGVERGVGLEARTGEVGYWLSREYWGRGLVSAALRAVTQFAFSERSFERLQAQVFRENEASGRVLEKVGYRLEGTRSRALSKGDSISDALVFVRLRPPVR